MRLTIVGCTGSMSGPKSAASSYLLQAVAPSPEGTRTWSVLFDLGPGSYGQMWHYVDPAQIDAVVLSHLHADHCGDMISLQVFQKWAPQSTGKRLPIYGPVGLEHRMKQLGGDMDEDFTSEFGYHEIPDEGGAFQIGPFNLMAFPAWHTVTTFGLRVEGPAGFPEGWHDAVQLAQPEGETSIFAYTGDTDYCKPIVQMAKGADLLLAEAGFLQKDMDLADRECRGVHMTAERTGQLAAQAGARALVATHIQPWSARGDVWDEVRRNWEGPLALASAGTTYII